MLPLVVPIIITAVAFLCHAKVGLVRLDVGLVLANVMLGLP